MDIQFLGTGTSTGVPQIGCHCAACTSTDPKDKRLRASAIVNVDGNNLLIDCGPDFRTQILQVGSPALRALLITHIHYDHVGGMDDLRPYCNPDPFDVYCTEDVGRILRDHMPYSFTQYYPGAPTYNLHYIKHFEPFAIDNTEILPVKIMHGRLPITGYRIGNMAYITDCSDMPDKTIDALHGLDTLVINGLRHKPHPTHYSLNESLGIIERLKPRQAYLTHISHDMGPANEVVLPRNVSLAYDYQKSPIRSTFDFC